MGIGELEENRRTKILPWNEEKRILNAKWDLG